MPTIYVLDQNKKKRYTPVNQLLPYIKVGYEGVYISRMDQVRHKQACVPTEDG